MGRKYKKYSPELREEILLKYLGGRGYRSIARDYPDISVNTIHQWVRKAKQGVNIKDDHRLGSSGRFTKRNNLTLEDYKERYEILKKYLAFLQARREKK